MYLMLLLLVRDDRRPKIYTNKRQSCAQLRKHNTNADYRSRMGKRRPRNDVRVRDIQHVYKL